MKTELKRILSICMVLLMIFTCLPYADVDAANGEIETHILTIENTCENSFTVDDSSEGWVSFFGDTTFSGCYGNQLSGVAKELYDSLVKNYATDKKTGEYTYAFETPFTFNAEISGGSIVTNDELEEIELELSCAIQVAMDAFLYDHPEVFWLRIISSAYGISASGNSTNGYTGIIDDITITPTEIYSGASSKISQYDAAVDTAFATITVTDSRYDTLKSVHDYICNNAYYNLVNEQRVHSSEPFFIGDGGVVCEGYAKTLKVLCDELSIPCVLVSGGADTTAEENGAHMWNYVQMDDGNWYLVDVTWDDQESKIYDTYFLANWNTQGFNEKISDERRERTDFSGTGYMSFVYPVLSSTEYTVHTHQWESEYTIDKAATCTESGNKSIHCVTCDETKDVTVIPATNHANKTTDNGTEATCTENGYTAGEYCPDCEEWIEGHEVITAQGHTDIDIDNYCDVCEEYMSAVVETGKCGDNVNYVLYEDGTLIISGSGNTYNYTNSGSDYSPFWYSDVKKAVIKDGVQSIGYHLFANCLLLEEVSISDSVTDIIHSAFEGCTSLKNIIIPDSVIDIGGSVFEGCSDLTSIVLSDNLKELSVSIFYDCSSLKEIQIPNGVEDIGSYAFKGCKQLSSVTIPANVTNIAKGVFMGCSNLKDITIPVGVLSIGDSAFESCVKLEQSYLPDSVKNIGSSAFAGCKNLVSIKISENVISIGDYAFSGCTSLESVNIPNSVKSMGCGTFSGCDILTSITIPNGVTSIGDSMFNGCMSLKNIIIPESILSIGGSAFSSCKNLTSVELPKSVISIGSYAFQGCDKLTNIIVPESVISIGAYAFGWCKDLVEVIIPKSVANLESGVFYDCSKLKYISLPVSVINISDKVFAYCDMLQEIFYEGTEEQWSCITIGEKNEKLTSSKIYYNHYNPHLMGEWIPACIPEQDYYTHVRKCLNCSYFEMESCTLKGVIVKNPSCFNSGIREYACTVCGYVVTEAIEKLAHTPSTAVTENRVEPKCEEKGSYDEVVYCSVCDTELSRTEKEIPALTHNWDEGVINSVSTCKTHGTKTYTCQNDVSHKKTEQVVLDYNNHEGETYIKDAAEATCTTNGYTGDIHCSGCNMKLSSGEVVSATGHANKTKQAQQDATCTDSGYTAGVYCPDCEKWLEGHEIINKLPHSFTTYTSDNNATCTVDGTKTAKCDNCEATDTVIEVDSATGHSETTLPAVAPTCIATGLTAGKKCTVCGTITAKQQIVDKLAHVTDKGTVTKSATCVAEGTKIYKCTVCKTTLKTETLSATGKHNSNITIPGKTASYASTGLTAGKKCSVCGKITVAQKTIAKLTLGKVSGLKAKKVKVAKSSEIALTWNAVAGAKGYEIYQQNGSSWKKIKTTSGTSYTVKKLKSNKTYKFKVRAVVDGASGAYSSTLKVETIPATISKLTLKAGSKQLTATWKSVSDISGYEVQYSTSKKFTKKTTKTVKVKKSSEKTTIKKLSKGKKYYVRVRTYKTVDGKKIYSGWSTFKNVKVK